VLSDIELSRAFIKKGNANKKHIKIDLINILFIVPI
jgi:hypothetical protein